MMNTEALEQIIAQIVEKEFNKTMIEPSQKQSMTVPIGVSARHAHVTQEHLEVLFGEGATLHPVKELMGGQYAAKECITIVGTNLRVVENVRILGPTRKETQVEVAKTDAIRLGINPPIRESGNIKGSAPITIVGPKGALYLKEGCIIAKKHIHISEKDANAFGLVDNQLVGVKIDSQRKGTLEEVQIRVHPTFTLQMHIDTDEANALGLKCNDTVEVIK